MLRKSTYFASSYLPLFGILFVDQIVYRTPRAYPIILRSLDIPLAASNFYLLCLVCLTLVGLIGTRTLLQSRRSENVEKLKLKSVSHADASVIGYAGSYLGSLGAVALRTEESAFLALAIVILVFIFYLWSERVALNPTLYFFGLRLYKVQVEGSGESLRMLGEKNLVSGVELRLHRIENGPEMIECLPGDRDYGIQVPSTDPN